MKTKVLALAIAALGAGVLPEPALAQERTAAIEEVVVTARRREESLQEVPISISVIQGEVLERTKVTEVFDLVANVPSFSTQGSSKEWLNLGIRGQLVNENLGTSDPAVNVYFGDALITRAMGTNQSMYDMQSVQVLKGVQGTLFGRNSTGGALILKPNLPTDSFDASIGASLGNYDHREISGMVNVPATDTLAVRLAAKVLQRDGYTRNINTDEEIEDKDMQAWRVSVKWNPTESIESTTIYDHYEHDNGTGSAFTFWSYSPTGPSVAGYQRLWDAAQSPFLQSLFPTLATSFPAGGSPAQLLAEQRALGVRKTRSVIGTGLDNLDPFGSMSSEAEHWGVQNATAFTFDNFTIKNIAAYREVDVTTFADLDGGNYALIEARQGGQFDFVSEELQFLGQAFDDRLDWIFGLYYMKEDGADASFASQSNVLAVEGTRLGVFGARFNPGDLSTLQPAVDAANAAALAASRYGYTTGDVENESTAAYLGTTYRFNDTWILAGGLRYTDDYREYVAQSWNQFLNTGVEVCALSVKDPNTGAFVTLPADACRVGVNESFDEVTYDATLTYNFSEDARVYGAFRHGYRSGGFPGRARRSPDEFLPFKSEKVDEFEIGFKSDFGLGSVPVRFNAAIFTQDYTDIQRQDNRNIAPPGQPPVIATVIRNAAEATISGGELELSIYPTESLSISLFGSMLDGEFNDYTNDAGVDLSDTAPLFLVPEDTAGIQVNLTTPVGDLGELVWNVNAYAQSEAQLADDPSAEQDGYTLYNASVSWAQVAGTQFDLRVWGRNLTDEEYRVGGVYIQGSAGTAGALWGAPETYGLDVTYRFAD